MEGGGTRRKKNQPENMLLHLLKWTTSRKSSLDIFLLTQNVNGNTLVAVVACNRPIASCPASLTNKNRKAIFLFGGIYITRHDEVYNMIVFNGVVKCSPLLKQNEANMQTVIVIVIVRSRFLLFFSYFPAF